MGGGPVIDCPEGQKVGSAAGAEGLLTAGGIEYNVRVPADYEPTRAHPLLVVFSPHATNDSPADLEVFTGLGPDATARGYVVAFAGWFDPVPTVNQQDANTLRVNVAATWCIDEARVYYAGHSDGGSMSTVLPLMYGAPVAAIAPSAAGIDVPSCNGLGCDGAVPTMVIHSVDDAIFPVPSHGIGAADHWAGCFGCGGQGAPLPDGCVPYTDCAEGSEVLYCAMMGEHYAWYGLNESMLDFFDRHARPLL